MGVGDYPAGFEPAGDPVPSVTPSVFRQRPLALRFDPLTRSHVYDAATGRYAEIHPIDAKVVNALFIRLRGMTGVPGAGADWKRNRSPWTPTATATIRDIVLTALAQPIRDTEIQIQDIRSEAHGAYASFVEVSYVNLLTQRATVLRVP